MTLTWPTLVVAGLVSIVWLYIVARVVTRAILRTIEEKKKHG